jgi:hypothetical protein
MSPPKAIVTGRPTGRTGAVAGVGDGLREIAGFAVRVGLAFAVVACGPAGLGPVPAGARSGVHAAALSSSDTTASAAWRL